MKPWSFSAARLDLPPPAEPVVGAYLPYYELGSVSPQVFDYLSHVYYFSLGPNTLGDLGRVDGAGVFTPLSALPGVPTDISTLIQWRGTRRVTVTGASSGCCSARHRARSISPIRSLSEMGAPSSSST